ncbi:helix-turn-helix domain-containing protein [Marvinbryantia formatexigens]|nr:helix-turn-helix transcriptional regulator [Marvinbryantia formatexigens]UWO26276.1 helix-turn-helix domain-containing protein [Marvinbryantia formatexigens DSM 14469]SDG09764.1 Helix-turn-helix domain-containing protein [Marvinbryantia formatexigens]
MTDIGFVLKNARENKEMTQQKVMELTGINRKSLSGYENNVAEPDLSTFATLISLYGLSADAILNISPARPAPALTRYDRQLLSLFKTLDESHQKELLVQINALVKYLQKDVQNKKEHPASDTPSK